MMFFDVSSSGIVPLREGVENVPLRSQDGCGDDGVAD
jgi:hypothetical protein